MGKTLSKIFEGCKELEIAQLYVHNESPCRSDICNNYYRITDKDALTSIITKAPIGTIFTKNDIAINERNRRVNSFETKIYQKGRSRTPAIYLIRDTIWRLSKWNNTKLKNWINKINPDVIFLASGDYEFVYKITNRIVDNTKKPLIVMCFDDYYLYNKNKDSVLGRMRQKWFLKTVRNTMDKSKYIITVCETMAKEYSQLFQKECYVLYTPAEKYEIKYKENADRIAYFGGLGLGRSDQLVTIGRTLKNLNSKNSPKAIDVYSSETRKRIIKKMIPENGIKFHRAISQEEMKIVLAECMAVIHTESFNQTIRQRIKYSVSTKIAESLSYGPCLIAYGPSDIASIQYLKKGNAAIIATDEQELQTKLKAILSDKNLRNETVSYARKMAQENHNQINNSTLLISWLKRAVNG